MSLFLKIMKPARGAKILDIGGVPSLNGTPGFWHDCSDTYDITLLNLPGEFAQFSTSELAHFRLIEADVCTLSELPTKYDIVFSNSVIEHVGSERRQKLFANFVKSAGNAFWIQTPSPLFPVEAHCNVPFWWFLPSRLRKKRIIRWIRTDERFLGRQMASTRPIWTAQLRRLFPSCALLTESVLGFPKSQIAYGRFRKE